MSLQLIYVILSLQYINKGGGIMATVKEKNKDSYFQMRLTAEQKEEMKKVAEKEKMSVANLLIKLFEEYTEKK